MSSRKQRSRLYAERRMAYDRAVEQGRIARREQERVAEDIDLEPKKKSVKSANKASQKGTKNGNQKKNDK